MSPNHGPVPTEETTMTVAMLAAQHWDGWHHHGWGPPWPFFAFLVIVGIVLVALIWSRRHSYSHRSSAQAVLAERYARGEIDAAEYRERRAELRRRA